MADGVIGIDKHSDATAPAPAPDHLVASLSSRIRLTVRRRLSAARHITPEDEQDIVSNAITALLVRLRRARQAESPIEDLDAYAAAIASNAADRFFGQRAPQRTRLRLRIRYVLTTVERFRLEMSTAGVWTCSLNRAGRGTQGGKLARLVGEILERAGGRLELAELTTQAAHILGVSDLTEEPDPDSEASAIPSAAGQVELRDWLGAVWREIGDLPERQRIALLLQFGASENCSMCSLVDLGIVRFGELAAALGLTKDELAQLWNRVPLSDREISERLGITRQQVINLRSSARERLSRRLANIGAKLDTNRKDTRK